MAEARKLLATGGEDTALVVVEGYMDAIACQRAGVAAVAPLGTALTEEQMEALWRVHPQPTLCFDGDKAGQRAAFRAIDRALPLLKSGRSFKFALVTGGKDPDDVLREQGAGALRAQLAQTQPFVEVLFARERDAEPLDTPEHRAGLKARLRTAAAAIQDADLSAAYRDDFFRRLDALFGTAPQRRTASRGTWRKDPRRPAYEDAPMTASGRAGSAALRRKVESWPAASLTQARLHAIWRLEDTAHCSVKSTRRLRNRKPLS